MTEGQINSTFRYFFGLRQAVQPMALGLSAHDNELSILQGNLDFFLGDAVLKYKFTACP